MSAVHLKKDDFVSLVGSYKQGAERIGFVGARPAIVDFYADWCAPCRMLSPLVEEISDEYKGRIDVYKVNVDEEEELAALFSIRSIPTLVFIEKDGTFRCAQGAMGRTALAEMVRSLL